jgi:hypothetical protein
MCKALTLSAFALITTLAACGGAGSLDYPAGPDGGKKLVEDILKSGDRGAMVAKLKPSKADVEALFDASIVDAILGQVDMVYGQVGDLGVKPDQTEVLFNAATTEDFVGATDAAKKFPGGYARVAPKLKTGVTWYAWKFVKPGETLGMAYDGLAHVNGRWVWIPKPYRAVKE